MIVVLRNQLHSTPDKRGYWAARDRDAGSTQAPLVAGVRAAGGRVSKQFQLLNAFVATVGPAELTRLRNDPEVSGVYPNVSIESTATASPAQLAWEPNGSPASSPLLAAVRPNPGDSADVSSTPGVTPDTSPAPTGSAVCGTSSDPLLEPEALQLTHTAASANEAAGTYESSTGITGAGVTVATIAGGIDTSNADLQRSGSPIATEVNFGGTSDGNGAYEMFGDVSSIAAQGTTTYDISDPSISGIVDNATALGASGSGCDIRVRGVAPGFLVPSGTIAVSATTQATASGGGGISGIGFDFDDTNGYGPDIGSSTSGSSGVSTSTLGVSPSLPEVGQGWWYLTPAMMGAYDSSASGTLTTAVTATTLGFDSTVTSSTGDDFWWYGLADYPEPNTTPASVAVGASANISVTFAPPASTQVGTVVQGTLQVNNENNAGSSIGDVMASIPYEYTVGTAPTTTTTTTATTSPAPTTTTSSGPVRAGLGGTKVRGTNASVPVSCPRAAPSACLVTLKLTVVEKLKGGKVVAVAASAKSRSKTRTVVVGSATVTAAPGKAKTAELGLNRAGKEQLARRHTLTALLTATEGTIHIASVRVSFRTAGKR